MISLTDSKTAGFQEFPGGIGGAEQANYRSGGLRWANADVLLVDLSMFVTGQMPMPNFFHGNELAARLTNPGLTIDYRFRVTA